MTDDRTPSDSTETTTSGAAAELSFKLSSEPQATPVEIEASERLITSVPAKNLDTLIGQVIDGKYRVLNRLGHGGMGAVFRAEHLLMERTVALKVLHPHLVQNQELLKRFQHEARIASKLRHPNAIATYDCGMYEDSPYLVMEFVEGRTLSSLIAEQGALPVKRVAEIFRQVGSALAQAHQLGIVHRDLKPDNVMLVPQPDGSESAVVLDFGIAKILTEQGGDRTVLTQTGMFYGTPRYASPEQVAEQPPDRRADIYALGIMLYEALSGDVPFNATSVMELLIMHLQREPVPLREFKPELQIPPAIDAIVMKCLRKKPEDRFQSIEELLEALAATQSGPVDTGSLPLFLAGTGGSGANVTPTVRAHSGTIGVLVGFCVIFGAAGLWWWSLVDGPVTEPSNSISSFAALVNSSGLNGNAGTVTTAATESSIDSRENSETSTNPPVEPGTAVGDPNAAVQAVGALAKLFSNAKPTQNLIEEPQQIAREQELQHQEAAVEIVEQDLIPEATKEKLAEVPAETEELPASDSTLLMLQKNELPADAVPAEVPSTESATRPTAEIAKATPKESATEAPLSNTKQLSPAAAKREAIKNYDAGMKLYQKKRYAEAAVKFEEAVKFRSDAVRSFIALGTCYQRLKFNEKALNAFTSAIRVDPKYSPGHYNLAAFYALTGQSELALEKLQTAVRLDPKAKRAARAEPDFISLRANPKFKALVQ
jgi:serine/threonine protein kinase/Flp pilus assembly protein TadD